MSEAAAVPSHCLTSQEGDPKWQLSSRAQRAPELWEVIEFFLLKIKQNLFYYLAFFHNLWQHYPSRSENSIFFQVRSLSLGTHLQFIFTFCLFSKSAISWTCMFRLFYNYGPSPDLPQQNHLLDTIIDQSSFPSSNLGRIFSLIF